MNSPLLRYAYLALLPVHEARHKQGKVHTCTLTGRAGIDDVTLSEVHL